MRDLVKNERNPKSAIIVDFIRKNGEKPVNWCAARQVDN